LSGSDVSLADDLTIGGGGNLLVNGHASTTSLITNNHTVTCAIFGDGGTAGAVTLTLGSSTINCTNVSFSAATLTVSDNTATINVTSTADITSNLGNTTWGTGGDTSFVYVMTGGKSLTITGDSNTVGSFSVSWTSVSIASALIFSGNLTVGTFSVTGSSVIARPSIYSTSPSVRRTITASTVSITGAVDFGRIIGAGAGSWDLSGIASGDLGWNAGITFRTPANYYATTLTANRAITDNIWSTTDDGTADGTSVFPLPQDTIVLNNNTGDNSNKKLTLSTSHRLGGIDASTLTESLTIEFNWNKVCGDIVLPASGLTVSSNASTFYIDSTSKNDASDTLDINSGASFGSVNIILSGYQGSYRLLENLTHTGTFTLTDHTLNLNGKTLTTATFSSSNYYTRELQFHGGKIVVNGLTGTIFDMSTATNLTVHDAGNIDIGDSNNTLTGDVTLNFGGKTFGDLKLTKHAGNYDYIIAG
jgi:hypothetical protein